jgi:hypothetical protein
MSDQGWVVRGPRWWLVVRLVGAIGWALLMLSDIAWKLLVGWPTGPDSLAGGARWLVLAGEGVGVMAFGDWAWLAWRRLRLLGGSEPSEER